MNTCSTCRFFHVAYEHHTAIAQCRRRSPVITEARGRLAEWPITDWNYWCGDFEIKPELRPCKTCDKPVGEIGFHAPHLKHSTLYPICKVCHDKFEAGTHPYQQSAKIRPEPESCRHEFVNSDRNLKTYACAQCGAALDEQKKLKQPEGYPYQQAVPPKIPMITECESCKCVFTFAEEESEKLSNNGGGSVFFAKCPNCGRSCSFDTGYPDIHIPWRLDGKMSETDRIEHLSKQRASDRSVKQRQAALYALMGETPT